MFLWLNKIFCKKSKKFPNDSLMSKLDILLDEDQIILYDVSNLIFFAKQILKVYKMEERFIVIEKETELIIVIKGTDSITDIKIDLTIGNNFHYHDGIMDLTMDILLQQNLLNIIINSNKKIIITGHSLSAVVSVYVLLIIQLLHPKKNNIFVYAFGTPPVIPVEYIQLLEPYTTFIINKYDVIPSILPTMTWTTGDTKILHLTKNKIILRHWSFFKRASRHHNTKDHSIISYINHLQNILNLK